MINLELPELKQLCFKKVGLKNSVQQLLDEQKQLEFEFISSHRGYVVIESNGSQFCLTTLKDSFPEEFEFVLLTNRKATEDALSNGQIKLKSWLKHPKMIEHSTDDVLNSWENRFSFIEENIEDNTSGFREPQIAGLYSILSHLKVSDECGTVVMPTGTGKTETMLGALVATRCERLLITVPSDALRTQIANKFYTLGLLKRFGILNEDALFPKVGVLYHNFRDSESRDEFVDKCNVLITTMSLLANNSDEDLEYYANKFKYLFIDEAHHSQANSWKRVKSAFRLNKILQFTATPFRNDGKRLDGKVIFNFSLRKAQEQGYFRPINFLSIREYDFKKGDEIIAEKAVSKLREDLAQGLNHVLMARCENKRRAEEIFEIYSEHDDLSPILIHSSIAGKKDIVSAISNIEHRIIVAVDMLGEGFDLPQLKIAAFHDIRKSLPVTLQFAGRFTRTALDEELGNATFVANIANAVTEKELSELYAKDSDWNSLLSRLSENEIQEQIDFNEFLEGFQHMNNSQIPFQNIRFPMSAVAFKNTSDNDAIDLARFYHAIPNYEELNYRFYDYNSNEKTLVLITAQSREVDWVNYKDIYGLHWDLTVFFYDDNSKLLFIHSSDRSQNFKRFAEIILEGFYAQVHQLSVFRCFHNINRVSLQNVGLKEFLNRKIRFTMRVGTDIEEALSLAEQQRGQKAFVFGAGYEEGIKITIGCSYKGRIWSYLRNDLKGYINWCRNIGIKLIDDSIDPNQVLKQTLIPVIVSEIPKIYPTHIDWHEDFYLIPESRIYIRIEESVFSLFDCSLGIINSNDQGVVEFEIRTPSTAVKFKKELFEEVNEEGETFANFKITRTDNKDSEITIGNKTSNLLEYLNNNPVMVWFADGSSLQGIEYVELKQVIQSYPPDNLICWNWEGVDISQEAQRVFPLRLNSIQYKVIQNLLEEDFDIVYDDDYSGEIADVITIKETESEIRVQFYHIKYARNGEINTRIDNFYEVCGQAQKSIHWKHKKGTEFFEHLLRRRVKSRNGNERSRIEKGDVETLEKLLLLAKNQKPMVFEIFIVQPSLSIQNVTDGIMTLLGVTDNYLKEVGGINLKVIVNE